MAIGALRAQWRGLNGVRLHWRVDDIAGVLVGGWTAVQVYSAAAKTGPFVALGSPVALVADQEEYSADLSAGTEVTWYSVALWKTGPVTGDKWDPPVQGSGGGMYATVAGLRDEGVTVTQASNDRLRKLITQAEGYLERITGRWFYPRLMSIRVDGSGAKVQGIDPEIVQVDGLEMLWEPFGVYPLTSVVDLDGVVVYNRHLTQGIQTPDDREDPKLVIEQYAITELGLWPKGKQNILMDGWFGYTELGPDDPVGETEDGSQIPLSKGRTPPLIIDAVMRLVVRYLPLVADTEATAEVAMAHRIQSEKTRDQEVTYSATGGGRGAGVFTGDRFIDDVLATYMKPSGASMV